MKYSPRDPLVFLIAGSLILACLLVFTIRAYILQSETGDWVQGEAKVVSVEIIKKEIEAGGRWVTDHYPRVSYTYTWNGKLYHSARLSVVIQKSRIYEEVIDTLTEYNLAPGAIVPVFIRPDDPAYSVLITDFTQLNQDLWLLLYLMLPLGLIGGFASIWKRCGDISYYFHRRRMKRLRKTLKRKTKRDT